jgi:hypothetical protein
MVTPPEPEQEGSSQRTAPARSGRSYRKAIVRSGGVNAGTAHKQLHERAAGGDCLARSDLAS